jgi:ATP-dependent Clp protease ATP-binding subunit ClpA
MDEAASRVRMESEEALAELKALEEKISALHQGEGGAVTCPGL